MLDFILLEGGITWSTVWTQFNSVWSSCYSFFTENSVFLAIIGVPIVAGIIGVVAHAIR